MNYLLFVIVELLIVKLKDTSASALMLSYTHDL